MRATKVTFRKFCNKKYRLDVHESVHRDTIMKVTNKMYFFFFAVTLRPNAGHGLLILRFLDHTQRRTTVGRTPLDE